MLKRYSIRDEIYRGRTRVVFRAVCDADDTAVIIKTVGTDVPTEHDVAELRREYELLSSLSIDGVVKAHEFNSDAGAVQLVLEDRGGVTLAEHLRSDLDLASRLRMAVEITSVLAELHDNSVLHKDINPGNILVDPASGKITMIDFSISTRLAEEHQPVIHPNVLEGTLAYVSPEQTGRMNRPVDYRSDFYSLGATFFELFTERVPFQAADPMELVHSHMAIPAPSPAAFRGELPASLCMVILKLLEKAPEDRYQSASGILEDLRACQSHVQSGRIPEDFQPGAHDLRDRFSIPKKLYGRQGELKTLVQAFERISRHGAELLLVSGYSGIGKSALSKAVQGPVTEHRGYFVTGKFDQLQRTVPYSALVTALGELVLQLLTETDEALADWSRKLRDALNDNGQLVVDVIPEVEYVIGPQRELPMLDGDAARNRFRMVFHNFIRVFCRREHPLVIFLDDLQWADPASLTLLEAILADDEAEHLLLIGAYRDNEVDDSHPLVAMVEALKSSGGAVTEVPLGP